MSTLIKPERRSGNTTRQIDNAVQELFTKGETKIIDHHGGNLSNDLFFNRLVNRLKSEHRVHYEFDSQTKILYLR